MPDVELVAPAQPDAPSDLTPGQAAAVADDFPAFQSARLAERIAPPAAPTPTPPVAVAAPVADSKPVSKRQQDINDRIRSSVEAATRDLAAENARLRQASAPSRPAPVVGETFPDYANYLTEHAEASLEEYIDARQDWRADHKAMTASAAQRARDTITQKQTELVTAQTRVLTALEDPAFETRFKAVPQVILDIPTRELVEQQQRVLADARDPRAMDLEARPENDFASEIVKSEHFPQLLVLAHEDPTVLAQVRACATRRDVLKLVAKLETRFESGQSAAASAAAPTKTLTAAPGVGTTLGSRSTTVVDPIRKAVADDDFESFRAARLAQRAAARR